MLGIFAREVPEGVDPDDFRRNCCLSMLTGLNAHRILAEAEAITAESAQDTVARRTRELLARASAKPTV